MYRRSFRWTLRLIVWSRSRWNVGFAQKLLWWPRIRYRGKLVGKYKVQETARQVNVSCLSQATANHVYRGVAEVFLHRSSVEWLILNLRNSYNVYTWPAYKAFLRGWNVYTMYVYVFWKSVYSKNWDTGQRNQYTSFIHFISFIISHTNMK